jgi:hypothetical protein
MKNLKFIQNIHQGPIKLAHVLDILYTLNDYIYLQSILVSASQVYLIYIN